MTLLVSLLAAVAASVIWYGSAAARELRVGVLCYLFWGASLMWAVDVVAAYVEQGAEVFAATPAELLADATLGVCVVALGLVIWVVRLFLADPRGVVRGALASSARLF